MTADQSGGSHLHNTVWGPYFWGFIHSYSLTAAADEVAHARDLLKRVCLTVPCSVCKPHADEYFRDRPEYDRIDTQAALFKFYVDFHNAVNLRTDSCHGQWTVEQARQKYSKPPPRPCSALLVAAFALGGVALGVVVGRMTRQCEITCALPRR